MGIIKITGLGQKELSGFYIGRPSILGNPYPTKVSKFRMDKIYTLEESMKKYRYYLIKEISKNEKIKKIIKTLKRRIIENKEVQLNCWCLLENYNFENYIEKNKIKCHGQAIIEFLYHNINKNVIFKEEGENRYKIKMPLYVIEELKGKDLLIKDEVIILDKFKNKFEIDYLNELNSLFNIEL